MICRIVAAGEGRLEKKDLEGEGLILAADAGYLRLRKLGVTPDVIIGDFDSSRRPTDPGVKLLTVPCEKDDTDTGLAAEYGYEAGCREFVIFCGMGGRPDHEYANYQLLVSLARRGCSARLCGGAYDVYCIHDSSLPIAAGYGGVSVFCAGERARGVDIVGLKYPLSDAELTCDFPLGVSNERTGRDAVVSVKDGTLLVMVENA